MESCKYTAYEKIFKSIFREGYEYFATIYLEGCICTLNTVFKKKVYEKDYVFLFEVIKTLRSYLSNYINPAYNNNKYQL